ncbi:MAG: RNA 2',3'-cyclic phosphodiesterase [Streptosporangiaceae bacterium]
MRLFVAITPPPAALGELEAAVALVRGQWPGLRWTGYPDWHVTLAFLGEIGEPVAGRLAPRLERAAARHHPLRLALAGAGAFPSAARARVLWCGLSGDRAELAGLAASVAAAARRAGAGSAAAEQAFRPHLTLARGRAPADARPLVRALSEYEGRSWTADRLHLIQSRLGQQPRYEAVGSWAIGGGAAGPAGG